MFRFLPICVIITITLHPNLFPNLFANATSVTIPLGEIQRNGISGLEGMCTVHLIEYYQMALKNSTLINPPTLSVGKMPPAGLPSIQSHLFFP
jgi:hypothetical protein